MVVIARCSVTSWAETPRIIKSQAAKFELHTVIDGLGTPWGLAFISDRQIIITEREGNIHLVNVETGKLHALKGAPAVLADGQGGMLDVAISA